MKYVLSLFHIVLLLLIHSTFSIKLKVSKTNSTQQGPPNPVAYYKDGLSWFTTHGLSEYYGTYCKSASIVGDITSSSKPGFKIAYYTCNECLPIKDKYLSHPIGLIFAIGDKPQRVKYIDSKDPKIEAYRCQ